MRGHADARSRSCYAKTLSKKERDVILADILREVVQKEYEKIAVGGK